jgi:hypothetical protein
MAVAQPLDHPWNDNGVVMHKSTFEYLKPTIAQMDNMEKARQASAQYALALENLLPDGPDKTFTLRNHRTTAMWANIAITRNADGSPRE